MAIDRDPVIWNDLLSFKPERFLDSCLDIKGNNFDYMPSGAGRKIFPTTFWLLSKFHLFWHYWFTHLIGFFEAI